MKPAEKIIRSVRRSVQNVTYGNPLYKRMLAAGESPARPVFSPADPWPGDAQAGKALLSAQRSLFEGTPPRSAAMLRNLRAVGTDAARQASVRLIHDWLERHDQWEETEWSPEKIGDRITGWLGFYDFYAPVAPPAFVAEMMASLHRQWKHLLNALPPTLTDIASLRAIKGLIYGGLNFDSGDAALGVAMDVLKRQLAAEILPDGGHITRCPSVQLHMIRHLIDIRAAFKAAAIDVPDSLRTSIAAMLPVLKFFRHGDGALALFHGAMEESSLLVDAAFALADMKCRNLRRLPDTGYERLSAGRSLLIADVTAPPPRFYDHRAHAGLMAFEFGQGKERIIVNCGAVEDASPDWRMACAATAAHSTLGLDDINACGVSEDGVASHVHVASQRYEEDNHHCLEMSHDGYRGKTGAVVHRLLRLSANGDALIGREIVEGGGDHRFDVRWHIHPAVQISLSHGGQAALLRTASGAGWRLRVQQGDVSLESSIYCGSGAPRRSQQLRVSGTAQGKETLILWSLTREKMG